MSNFFWKECQKHKTQVTLSTLNLYQELKSILPYTHPAEMDKEMQYRRPIKCIKWYEAYQSAPKCTKRTRLVEFQFKLLRRRKYRPTDFLPKLE